MPIARGPFQRWDDSPRPTIEIPMWIPQKMPEPSPEITESLPLTTNDFDRPPANDVGTSTGRACQPPSLAEPARGAPSAT